MMNRAVLLFALVVLLPAAYAGRVAVVADNGVSVQTACVSFDGSKTAEDMLSSSGLGVEFDRSWGSALVCRIGGTGCPASNCFCSSESWAFYYSGGGSWTYSNVGVSDYHVSDGDVLGFSWTGYDSSWNPINEPEWRSFSSICASSAAGDGNGGLRHLNVTFPPGQVCAGAPLALNVSSVEGRGAPIWRPSFDRASGRLPMGVLADVFYMDAWWRPLGTIESNSSGQLLLLPGKTGNYSVELRREDYVLESRDFEAVDCSVPECASNAQCGQNEYCGEGGKCEPVSGFCGYAEAHKFVEYACCSDSACGADSRCEDHRCVLRDDRKLAEVLRVLFNYYI